MKKLGIKKVGDFFSLLADLFILNTMWLITSLPVVTIGASTTAVYYVLLKRRQDGGDGPSTWKLYKKAFAGNLKQGVFIGMIYLFLAVDVGMVVYHLCQTRGLEYLTASRSLLLFLVLFGVLYSFTGIYIYPLLAFFEQSTAQCFVNALGISFKYFLSTAAFILTIAVAVTACYLVPPLTLIAVSFTAFLITRHMYPIFLKCMERTAEEGQQRFAEKEERI